MWQDFHKTGFTLEDLAGSLSLDYESVRSFKQTLGRASKRWKADTGSGEPLWLEYTDYNETDGGMRCKYSLPEGMTEAILELSDQFMTQPAGPWTI